MIHGFQVFSYHITKQRPLWYYHVILKKVKRTVRSILYD